MGVWSVYFYQAIDLILWFQFACLLNWVSFQFPISVARHAKKHAAVTVPFLRQTSVPYLFIYFGARQITKSPLSVVLRIRKEVKMTLLWRNIRWGTGTSIGIFRLASDFCYLPNLEPTMKTR